MKVREGGRIVTIACLLTVAINAAAHPRSLASTWPQPKTGPARSPISSTLGARGLTGVGQVISDDHTSRADAIAATLPEASWQRCQTYYLKNRLTKVPRAASSMVATMVRTIFSQPLAKEVSAQHRCPQGPSPPAPRRLGSVHPVQWSPPLPRRKWPAPERNEIHAGPQPRRLPGRPAAVDARPLPVRLIRRSRRGYRGCESVESRRCGTPWQGRDLPAQAIDCVGESDSSADPYGLAVDLPFLDLGDVRQIKQGQTGRRVGSGRN